LVPIHAFQFLSFIFFLEISRNWEFCRFAREALAGGTCDGNGGIPAPQPSFFKLNIPLAKLTSSESEYPIDDFFFFFVSFEHTLATQ
jgi:hypothetical protein